jgi:hypothetical protein
MHRWTRLVTTCGANRSQYFSGSTLPPSWGPDVCSASCPSCTSTTLRLPGLGLGPTEAAWRLVRGSSVVVSPCGRRDDTTTTAAAHSPAQPSFSSCFTYSLHLHKQHTLLPAIGTVAHPQLPINPGLHTACTEVVCARGGVVSTTLARDSKVTRCLLCNCHRGFRISKATAEPQFDPPEQE